MNVFLSYARKDGDPFASRLRAELSGAGLNVWRDVESMAGTDDWRDQLREAVLGVDALVLILTPGAVESPHVTIEWELALTLGKPVLVTQCLACDVPDALAGKHYRDLTNQSAYTREVVALTRDLEGLKDAERKSVMKELVALREENAHAVIHEAVEALQRWLNGDVYGPKLISAAAWLLRQMSVDSGPARPVRAVIGEAVEGRYVQPNWPVSRLFGEQKPAFDYIFAELVNFIKDDSLDDSVPIVLAVMREDDARGLISGAAFDGYPDELREDFEELQLALASNGAGAWACCYRPSADEWQPFAAIGVGVSIRSLVDDVLASPELRRGAPAPLFIDIRSLADNRWLLTRLRSEGCVVVVDSISMRHPAIQHAFQQSMLDAYPKTSVVNIAPFQSAFELVRKMRVFLRLQVSDLEFDKRRRYRSEKYGVCREIYERGELEQWLFGRVESISRSKGGQRKGARGQMFKRRGGLG